MRSFLPCLAIVMIRDNICNEPSTQNVLDKRGFFLVRTHSTSRGDCLICDKPGALQKKRVPRARKILRAYLGSRRLVCHMRSLMPRNEAELELKVQVSLALLASLPHSFSLDGGLGSDEISTLGEYWSSLKCPG